MTLMVSVPDKINRAAIEKRYSFSKMEEPDFKVPEVIGGQISKIRIVS